MAGEGAGADFSAFAIKWSGVMRVRRACVCDDDEAGRATVRLMAKERKRCLTAPTQRPSENVRVTTYL
jgi:hypothetical protein